MRSRRPPSSSSSSASWCAGVSASSSWSRPTRQPPPATPLSTSTASATACGSSAARCLTAGDTCGVEAGGSPGRRVGATEISGRPRPDVLVAAPAAGLGPTSAGRTSMPHHSQIVSHPRTGARQCAHRPGGASHNRTIATGPRNAPKIAQTGTSRPRWLASHAAPIANPIAHARASPVTTRSMIGPPVRPSTRRQPPRRPLRYEKHVRPASRPDRADDLQPHDGRDGSIDRPTGCWRMQRHVPEAAGRQGGPQRLRRPGEDRERPVVDRDDVA